MRKKTTVFGKVLRRLRRYIPAVVTALILASVYVAASLYIPVLVGRAIDNIVDAGKVDFAAVSAELVLTYFIDFSYSLRNSSTSLGCVSRNSVRTTTQPCTSALFCARAPHSAVRLSTLLRFVFLL